MPRRRCARINATAGAWTHLHGRKRTVATVNRRNSPQSGSPGLSLPSSPLSSPISCRAASSAAQSPGDTSLNFIVDYPSERRRRGRRPLPVSKLEATVKWGRRLCGRDDLCFHLDDLDRHVRTSLSTQGGNIYRSIYISIHIYTQICTGLAKCIMHTDNEKSVRISIICESTSSHIDAFFKFIYVTIPLCTVA